MIVIILTAEWEFWHVNNYNKPAVSIIYFTVQMRNANVSTVIIIFEIREV